MYLEVNEVEVNRDDFLSVAIEAVAADSSSEVVDEIWKSSEGPLTRM